MLKKELGSGFKLFLNNTTGKIYRRVDTEREFLEIQSFMDKFKNIVFLRDCLDLSISLSMNMSDSKQRTELGELEYLVKYRADEIDYQQKISDIIQIFQETLEKLPYFKEVDYVCVIPSSHPFMKDIVRGLKGFVFEDISDNVSWEKSSEIKNAETLDEKLEALLKSNLKVSEAVDLKGKNVMLVDDLYNSGLTMQYVAMRLKELGVFRVFGVTLVKSLSNK